jgi:hypothetical protein
MGTIYDFVCSNLIRAFTYITNKLAFWTSRCHDIYSLMENDIAGSRQIMMGWRQALRIVDILVLEASRCREAKLQHCPPFLLTEFVRPLQSMWSRRTSTHVASLVTDRLQVTGRLCL